MIGSEERPPQQFGRYTDLEFLGQGGMAVVYKAFDPTLGRHVALKFIRDVGPESIQRLLLEARAQARIEHDRVCRIYEASEVDGTPYIAMQWIRGETLRAVADDLSLEEKVSLVKQVAEAIHSAHRAGLIHRDIKPANILVERSEDGVFIPFVLDFGLAREIQAPGVTMSGIVVGSPWYMSPEQARGEVHSLDRRADVYSLGVTLYEVVSGRLPFEGESAVEVLLKIIQEDPVPLKQRIPSVPDDLNTILSMCLEKEPQRRYDSARALAEDLGRFLEGEPILAKPAGRVDRLVRKARRHKAISAVSAAAILLVLVFAWMGLQARWTAKKQAALAQEYGGRIQENDAIMRFAHMAPLHDVRQQRAMVRDRIRKIEQDMPKVGKPGIGPGNYAIGRGYLTLGEYDKALQYLQTAWDNGYRGNDVGYALGLTLGQFYQRELWALEALPGRDLRSKRLKEITEHYRDPAIRYLQQSKGPAVESKEYIEALLAYYEKRYPDAIQKAEGALMQLPWLYEAKVLEGDIYAELGNARREEGASDEALLEYRKAQKAYEAASRIGQSNPQGYERTCGLWTKIMIMELYGAERNLEEYVSKVEESCNLALRADPENSEAYRRLSRTYRMWGENQMIHGQDPSESLKKAIETGDQAIRLEPENALAYSTLSNAYYILAEIAFQEGQDPNQLVETGIRNCNKAIALSPSWFHSFNNEAILWLVRVKYQASRGQDTDTAWKNAVEDFEKALRINPRYVFAFAGLGDAYLFRAEEELDRGRDPSGTLANAEENYGKALELNPKFLNALTGMIWTAALRARVQREHGRDMEDSHNQAELYFERCLKVNEEHPDPYYALALFQIEHLRALSPAAEEVPGLLKQARATLDSAIKYDPSSFETYRLIGETETRAAEIQIVRRGSPDTEFRRAESALQKAIELNPNDAKNFASLAEWYESKANWRAGRNDTAAGLQAAEKALALNPALARADRVRERLVRISSREGK